MCRIIGRWLHYESELRVDVALKKDASYSAFRSSTGDSQLTLFIISGVPRATAPARHVPRTGNIPLTPRHREIEQMIQIHGLGRLPRRMRPRIVACPRRGLLVSLMRSIARCDGNDGVYWLIGIVEFVDYRSAWSV